MSITTKLTPAQKARERRLQTIFNTNLEEADAVKAYQNGKCYISGKTPKTTLHLDHDHRSGLLRGFLDPWINKGLSFFKDDPVLLRRAAEYLENPPYTVVVGEPVYGVIGRVSRKAKNRRYGPDGTKEPQPRKKKPIE